MYPVDHFEVSIICLSYVLYAAEDIDNGEKMQNILCLMSASYLYMLSMEPYSTQYPLRLRFHLKRKKEVG